MIARSLCALALVTAAALPVQGAVLYKSVTPGGTVMFSDTPPPSEAKILEERVIRDVGPAAPTPSRTTSGTAPADGAPIYQSVEYDGAIARANAKVDAAEHALALARRGTWQPVEGLRLGGPKRMRGDEDRVEFYQKELAAARKELLEVVRAKQLESARWEARQNQVALGTSPLAPVTLTSR